MARERYKKFAIEYCKDFNASRAYRDTYGEDVAGAGQSGHNLLKLSEIQELITERKEELAVAEGLTKEWVLRQWMLLASANPNELTELRIYPCPSCWIDESEREMFKELGFNPAKDPNATCAMCHGAGVERVTCRDTTKLSPAARRLFAGVKQTRNGIEIKMHDQTRALEKIHDYMGMTVNRSELSGPGGGPLEIAKTVDQMTEEQLLAIAAGSAVSPA